MAFKSRKRREQGGESTTEKLTAYLNEISVQLDPICQQSETSDAPLLSNGMKTRPVSVNASLCWDVGQR